MGIWERCRKWNGGVSCRNNVMFGLEMGSGKSQREHASEIITSSHVDESEDISPFKCSSMAPLYFPCFHHS